MVTDTKVFTLNMVNGQWGMVNRHRQCLQPIGRGYHTTVAIGLLLIRVILLYHTMVIALELLIPLHGTEIGGLQKGGRHLNILSLR